MNKWSWFTTGIGVLGIIGCALVHNPLATVWAVAATIWITIANLNESRAEKYKRIINDWFMENTEK